MNAFEALYGFWAGFGWEAYDENTVPPEDETPPLPYLTYAAAVSNFDEPVMLHASLFDRSTAWTTVTAKAAEINRAIGPGGKLIRYSDGVLWIKRGSPFAQRMPDENPSIRRLYLVIEAEFITNT